MKFHQNVIIDGEDQPAEYSNRKYSAFFNEGKWRNFILPLLPSDPEDRTFVEIGCNVGLYLRLAEDYGFRDVVGVEADPGACAMAERYRDAYGMDYRVLNRTVGVDFSFDELPAADVVLLANVHYYIHMSDFMPFLDRLIHKAIYCIVVSREMQEQKHGYPQPEIEPLRLMFRDWEMVRVIQTLSKMLKGDPHPRRVHSLLFQSRLQRQPIDYHTRGWGGVYDKQQELIDIIRENRDVSLEDTLTYRFWKARKQDLKTVGTSEYWTDEQVLERTRYLMNLTRDIMENGMKEPILARPDRIGIDGGNRAAILKLLGYNSIIVRTV